MGVVIVVVVVVVAIGKCVYNALCQIFLPH